jgi:hypothetical protein
MSKTREIGLIALVSLLLIAPQLIWGPGFSDSSDYNASWTAGMREAILAGESPRWLSGAYDGLGSPVFYFYPPLSFVGTGALASIGLPVGAALNTFAFLALLFSGASMWLWLRRLRVSLPVLGAILYMMLPYHLADLYTRGALAEFTAYIWIPLIALSIESLPDRRALIGLAVTYTCLILTHLPMAVLVSVFLIAPMVIRRAWSQPKILASATLAGVLGVGLSAVYLVPALALLDQVSSDVLHQGKYSPSSWSVAAVFGDQGVTGLLQRPLLSFCLIALGLATLPIERFWGAVTALCGIASLGGLPIWDLPVLIQVQFPWRLLAVVEFAAVTALCCVGGRMLEGVRVFVLAAAAVGILVVGVIWAAQSREGFRLIAEQRGWWEEVEAVQPGPAEYLPADMSESRRRFRRVPGEPIFTGGELNSAAEHGREISVAEPGQVVVRQFYFPSWRAIGPDSQRIETSADGQLGLISFRADQAGIYRLDRRTLWVEWVGIGISLFCLVALLWIFLFAAKRQTLTIRQLHSKGG